MGTLEDFLRKTHQSVDYSRYQQCERNSQAGLTCVACVGDQYFKKKTGIDYSCDDQRNIYVLRYLPVHIQEIKQALDGLRGSAELPHQWPNPVRVLSIGGGPGSDIAAFKKFVAEGGFYGDSNNEFEIHRLEKVKEWKDLAKGVINLYPSTGNSFVFHRITADLNDLPECAKGPFDVFLLSYVISELEDEECRRLGAAIKALAADRAVVILNDRNEDRVWHNVEVVAAPLNAADSFKRSNEEWCGLFYPDDLKDQTSPKLNLKSTRYGLILRK